MSGATLEQKKGVLELTKLEYQKKWYFPTYFANSVFGPNISKIDANGPFWPHLDTKRMITKNWRRSAHYSFFIKNGGPTKLETLIKP